MRRYWAEIGGVGHMKSNSIVLDMKRLRELCEKVPRHRIVSIRIYEILPSAASGSVAWNQEFCFINVRASLRQRLFDLRPIPFYFYLLPVRLSIDPSSRTGTTAIVSWYLLQSVRSYKQHKADSLFEPEVLELYTHCEFYIVFYVTRYTKIATNDSMCNF